MRCDAVGAGSLAGAVAAFGATMAIAVTVAASDEGRAAAASRPRLVAKSFSTDRTIVAGRTTTVTAHCGRGFSLLASRFHPIGVKPAGGRSAFETLAIVPHPSAADYTFRNTGAATVRIRATADCVKFSGRASLRTFVVRRAVRLGGSATSAGAARSSARRLGVVCNRPNSIPADIGFVAKRNDLVRLSFFRRRGRIGVRGSFSGSRPERAKLLLSCLQGRGVVLAGRTEDARRSPARPSRADSPARASAAAPKIAVRYSKGRPRPFSEPLLSGLFGVVDRKRRLPWGSPLPAGDFSAHSLAGRAFLEARAARASARRARNLERELAQVILFGEVVEGDLRGALWTPEIAAFSAFLFADKRTTDRVSQRVGAPGVPEDPGREKRKVVKFEFADNCDPGFFVDVYIPADAVEPFGHRFVGDPPCKNATVVVEKFSAGTEPPGTPDSVTEWQDHATYRLRISGDAGIPRLFEVEVTWEYPPA